MNAAQLTSEVNVLTERVANLRHELDQTKAVLQRLETELQEARQEATAARVRLDEQIRRTETWDGRRWALFLAAVTFISGVISGLIVTYARKP